MGIRYETLYLVVEVDAPGGGYTLQIRETEIEKYKADRIGYVASVFGMNREEYAEWVDLDGAVMCCGVTVSGRRCRNISKIQYGSRQWLDLRRSGWRCHIHENDDLFSPGGDL